MAEERISLQEIIGLLMKEPSRYEGVEAWPVLKFTNGNMWWTITFRHPEGVLELKGKMARARELLQGDAR